MAIEVVVAGLGGRGRDWVREVRASPAYKLAGCADVDGNVRRSAAADLRIPRDQCFENLPDAIGKTECQAVIVATPPDLHTAPCESALARGLAVLVEKPFATRLHEAVRLVSLAEQHKAPLLVAQNYRYLRSFGAVKRLIADGVLGRVGLVTCQYYRPPHDLAISTARLPHSVLWGIGVHHLDALRYALGSEVTSVAAESFTLADEGSPPGRSLRAILTFADGARAIYSASYESSGHEFFERGQEFYTRLTGDRATLHVFQRWLVFCEKGKLPRLLRRGSRKLTEEQILLRQLERALLHGEPAEVSGRDNLHTMAVLEACVRSATEQTWIDPQALLHESQ